MCRGAGGLRILSCLARLEVSHQRQLSVIFVPQVKAALGLDRCFVRATGAAPISLETLEYFMSLDVCTLSLAVCSGAKSSVC